MDDKICDAGSCPVVTTLSMIGGKYKALILWHLLDHTRRFGELRRLIPQATAKMLTQQLRELETAGFLTRTVYPVVPPKVEYSLTDLGQSFRSVLHPIYNWGERYMNAQGIKIDCDMAIRKPLSST